MWAALFVAAVYGLSAAQQPGGADFAEMQGLPYILGIAHPTGFPVFVLLGYVFSHVVAIDTIAWRMSFMCGIAAAGAIAFGIAIARRLGIAWWLAVPAFLWFAFLQVPWSHAADADVHLLLLFFESAIVYCTVRWLQTSESFLLPVTGALWGLALATHPNAVWIAPGLLLALLFNRASLKPRDLAIACASFAIGLAFYAYLPLRSLYVTTHHLDPTMGLAGLDGGIYWNVNNPQTLHGFLTTLSGSQFGTSDLLKGLFDPTKWPSFALSLLQMLLDQYGAFGFIVLAIGFGTLALRAPRIITVITVMAIGAIPFAVLYYDVEGDLERYRYLALWAAPLFLAGAGGFARTTSGRVRKIVVAVFLIASMALTFRQNSTIFGNRTDDGQRHLIVWLAGAVPQHSIIVTPWLDATPFAYGAYVDGSLPGRTIVAAWPDDVAAHFAQWSKREPVYVIAPPDRPPTVGQYIKTNTYDAYHAAYLYVPLGTH